MWLHAFAFQTHACFRKSNKTNKNDESWKILQNRRPKVIGGAELTYIEPVLMCSNTSEQGKDHVKQRLVTFSQVGFVGIKK